MRLRALVVLFAITGCGRIAFDELRDASVSDMAVIDPDVAAACPWNVNFTMSTPEPVPEVSTAFVDAEPLLMPDGLGLYVANNTNNWDLYYHSRPTPSAPFGPATLISLSMPASTETRLTISADGTQSWFSSSRVGDADIYFAPRIDATTFGAAVREDMMSQSPSPEYDPTISSDGLQIYYLRLGVELLVASRATTTAPFGPGAAVISELESSSFEGNPAISQDDRLIVFNSDRPGGSGAGDLYYATRADKTGPWSAPQRIPIVNDASNDAEPFVTRDGCELWFASERGTSGTLDIYRSRYLAL